jgi:hypothetical protein
MMEAKKNGWVEVTKDKATGVHSHIPRTREITCRVCNHLTIHSFGVCPGQVIVQTTAKHQRHITDRVQDILRFVSEAGVNDGGYCHYLLCLIARFFFFFMSVTCSHLGLSTAGKTRW